MPADEPLILALAARQLAAYNRADLDAFCACFHPDVVVLGADGTTVRAGLAVFRERYAEMFAQHRDVHAEVTARVLLGEHVVEHEAWSRTERATGTARSGQVLVRYSEQDGLIRWVQFLAPRG